MAEETAMTATAPLAERCVEHLMGKLAGNRVRGQQPLGRDLRYRLAGSDSPQPPRIATQASPAMDSTALCADAPIGEDRASS